MRKLLALALVLGCKDEPAKMTLAPEDVIRAIEDYAERGCTCETDKECFRAIRDADFAAETARMGSAMSPRMA